MITRRLIGLITGIVISLIIKGQDYHFSGFMQNMIFVNPGFTAMPSSAEIGLTYRNQWPGIPATFVTYGASVVTPVRVLNSGIGLAVMNDVQGNGVISRTSASLLYGYLINLGSEWQIGAGLSASWVLKQLDVDALQFPSELLGYGDLGFDNYSRNYPDFSVGIMARKTDFMYFGISAIHVTRPQDTPAAPVMSRLPIRYTAFAGGVLGGKRSNSALTAEPAIFYTRQKDNEEIIWGSMFNFSSGLMLGSWLRQDTKFSIDAVILTAGILWKNYNISYSYDVNMKKINFLSSKMAAHEVTFLYRFEYKDVHHGKKLKKSFCPAYR